jgi:hypothetical protein
MREIGSTVAHAFADERKKMAALIEKTLTGVAPPARTSPSPSTPSRKKAHRR